MLIEPFTTLAQIINFLILVTLLKHFLYAPITQAMTKREQYIADRLRGAADQEADARAEAVRYRQLQAEFTASEEKHYARMHGQVEAKRQAMLNQAQADVAASREQWYQSLQQEKKSFLRSLWQQTSQQLAQALRQALLDLADADLDQQVARRFIHRLQGLQGTEQRSLQAALGGDNDNNQATVVISTPTSLPQDLQHQLQEAIQQQTLALGKAPLPITFKTDPGPLCGIELRAAGYKLTWNLAQYLQQLETRLGQLLDQPLDQPRLSEPSRNEQQL